MQPTPGHHVGLQLVTQHMIMGHSGLLCAAILDSFTCVKSITVCQVDNVSSLARHSRDRRHCDFDIS